eukprot:GCRY01003607.1.p1 GENE.GCRY01003607.1~~GCRY01003607.1.p1  ORF type:complete len:281 (+),score=47.60 GCRY01003607.1:238-1080(+)
MTNADEPNRGGLSTGVLFLIVFLGLIYFPFVAFHEVPEGHVGVYFQFGRLLPDYSLPGLHFSLPFVTSVDYVQTNLQTDEVRDIPCGTSGGVVIYFEKIEVVNRLRQDKVIDTVRNYSVNYDKIWIFDKVHHEINQFCSLHTLSEVFIEKFGEVDELIGAALQKSCDSWAPGIEIISVRLTKPRIPRSVMQHYEDMEAEKTRFLHEVERQRVVLKEAETRKQKAEIEANAEMEVAHIQTRKDILLKEAEQKIQEIEDEIAFSHSKSQADAEHYKVMENCK